MWDDETIQDSKRPKHEDDGRSSEPQRDALQRLERKVDELGEAMEMMMADRQELLEQIRQEADASSEEREMAGKLLEAAGRKETRAQEMVEQMGANKEVFKVLHRDTEKKLAAAQSTAEEVSRINTTVEGLPEALREAGTEYKREIRKWWRGRTWKTHAYHALTTVLTVFLMGFLSLYALHTQDLEARILTESDITKMEQGAAAPKIWWSLDQMTRERINDEHNLGWRTTRGGQENKADESKETDKSKKD